MNITPIQEIVRKNIADNILEKGAVSEAFGHSEEITYDWTGEEIKESLLRLLMKKKIAVESGLVSLSEMQIACDMIPTEDRAIYGFNGFEDKILSAYPILGKVYSYDCCSEGAGEISNLPNFETGSKIDTDSKRKAQVCNNYNNLLNEVISQCVDACQIDLMLSNLDDKKTYKLTNNQLKVLEQ